MSIAKPKVNDQFWFDYSHDAVKGSIERLDKAIQNVQTFTTALLTVYTASAIFTIEYKEIENIWLIVLFGLPYVAVLLGRWHAATSTVPVPISFDARIPDDIREAFNKTHDFKADRIKKIDFYFFDYYNSNSHNPDVGLYYREPKPEREKGKGHNRCSIGTTVFGCGVFKGGESFTDNRKFS